jgi:uncharacterized ferritin-like protein (DUF455 family)
VEIRTAAFELLTSNSLEDKLRTWPAGLTDLHRGAPLRIESPGRPPGLAYVPHGQARVPPPAGMPDPKQRARILHALANHELQAVECFAWALVAFPEAPGAFRRGLVRLIGDEQLHCRLYLERLAAHGVAFGAFPVSHLFWRSLERIETPLQFICALGLTFENANLDFGQELFAAAEAIGDHETAAVLARVHADEIRHVHFAWHWLTRWMPAGGDPFETYQANVAFPLGPARARGKTFDAESRRAAGLDAAFIERLSESRPTAPGGAPR